MVRGEVLRMGKTNFTFAIVIMVTILGVFFMFAMEDVEGAIVQSTFNETSSAWPNYQNSDNGVHTKDDYFVIPYVSSDDEIWIAVKDNGGGGSWEHYVVDDSSVGYSMGGLVNTQNNSLVMLYDFTGGGVRVKMHFPAYDWDVWVDWVIDGSPDKYLSDIEVNNTDRICIMTTETGYPYKIRYWVLDFENLTVEVGGSAGSVIGLGRMTTKFYSVQVVANMTGIFHFYWRQNDNVCHWWDLDESITERTFGSASYYLDEIVCLENDIYIGGGHVSGTGRPIIYYQASPEAAFTLVTIEVALRSYENGGMSLSTSQDSLSVTVISYCNTDERLTKWRAAWDASAGTWQASQTDTGVSDPDDITCYGHFGSLWPIHPSSGIRWTLPQTGWAVLGRDENGATDALDMIHDNPDWTADLTNQPPEFTNEIPINGSSGIQKQPWCYVTINDPGGDTMNVTWEENSTGSWIVRQQNLSVTNGTFWWQFAQATEYSVRYYWKVSANDSAANNTTIYHFDLLANPPPVGSLIFPLNESSGITLIPTCRISVSDPDGDSMNISWLENTTTSWVERHKDTSVSDGAQLFSFLQFSSYVTTYYWRINLTDGTSNVTYIYHFTTGANNPPSILNPIPINGSSGVSLSPVCYVTVGDHENMNISWFEWDGSIWTHQQTNTSVPSGTYGWLFSNASSNSTEYWWMANVTDGSINVSKMYYFTTVSPPNGEEEEEILDWTLNLTVVFMIIVVTVGGAGAVIMISRGMND